MNQKTMMQERKIAVLVVDDEQLARDRLKRLIANLDEYECVGEAENGEQALARVATLHPDIVILDIRMPGIGGMDVAKKLSTEEHPPALIFCSAYDEYALKAFQVSASGYLLKPVRSDDLAAALAKASQVNRLQVRQIETEQQQEEGEVFIANTWQGHEMIPFDHIYYFQADQKYLTVHHKSGETLSDQTLKELEQTYGNKLIRTHRNSLVNARHVEALCKGADGKYYIRIKRTHEKVPVSRRLVSEVKDQLDIH